MTPAERERDLVAWRKRLQEARWPEIERDLAGYPVFTPGQPFEFRGGMLVNPSPSLPPGTRASWRRGTWA